MTLKTNSSLCFFTVLIVILQVVVSIPEKYDTKIWEGEGGTVRVQEATKEYARAEKQRASASEAGRTKAQATSVEKYPATVNYPVVASVPVPVPVPVPVYPKRTYSVYPKGIYGQETGQYGQGLGQYGQALGQYGIGGYGSYGFPNGPFYPKGYTPNLAYSLGYGYN